MLNRTLAPDFHPIAAFELIKPIVQDFSNGIKAFVFDAADQDVSRIEWIFENNYAEEENPLMHTVLSALILDGTSKMTSAEIAEAIDFYGAFVVPEITRDYTSLTLFSLNKYLPQVLPLVKDILTDAVIPDNELVIYLRNSKQRLDISLKRNDFEARRLFNHTLFGDNRYGMKTELEDYDRVDAESLRHLYRSQYVPQNCTLIMAGHIKQETVDLVRDIFDQPWATLPTFKASQNTTNLQFPGQKKQIVVETRQDALQSALRLGNRTIARNHPDFPGLQVLNTLFGGYFGSRLMRNIREDKGFTYGIGSGIVSMKHGAYFTLSTEVGTEFTQATLDEISKEIQILRTELVGKDELDLVKNYMMGSLLGRLENILSHADRFKQVYFSGLELDYFTYYQQEIAEMDPTRIKSLAQQYLDEDQMTTIVVGKMN